MMAANLDDTYFSNASFNVEDLIKISLGPILETKPDERKSHGTPDPSLIALLDHFKRLDSQLALLQGQVDGKCHSVAASVAADEASYLASISRAERELNTLHATLHAMEGPANALADFGNGIGTRLTNTDAQQKSALRAAQALNHLAAFARATDLASPSSSSLPDMYNNESTMEEAASTVAYLQSALRKFNAQESKESDKNRQLVGKRGPPPPGTLEAATENIELYRSILDNRIVSRFDAAADSQDFDGMADCARMMAIAAGPRGDTVLISRYISTRPLFCAAEPTTKGTTRATAAGGLAQVDSSSHAPPAMRQLSELYDTIASSLRDESVILEQIFPEPGKAIAELVRRVFEQNVAAALEPVMQPPPLPIPARYATRAETAKIHAYLQFLAEVYRKTLALAEEAAGLAGAASGLNPTELADAACGKALEEYLALELAWLGGLGSSKLSAVKGTMDMETFLDALSMHEEAVKRCVQVSWPGSLALARSVRVLFHSSSESSLAPPSCLLGQAAMHMVSGLNGAGERCRHRLAASLRGKTVDRNKSGNTERDTLVAAANSEAAGSLGTLFRAISQAAEMMVLLRQYYDRVVAPHVVNSPVEAAACEDGMAELMAAVDDHVARALGKTMMQLFAQVAAMLASQQCKTDFRPTFESHSVQSSSSAPAAVAALKERGGVRASAADAPTDACIAASTLLFAMGQQAVSHLHGSNVDSLLADFARRTASTVEAHALKFTFSPEGALQWKRDLSEYSLCLKGLNARGVAPLFEDLHALANVLIVPPESLPGVVEGVSHIDRERVRLIVERREDWKSAKIGGKPLSAALGMTPSLV